MVRVLLAAKAAVNTQTKVSFVAVFYTCCYNVFMYAIQSGNTPLWIASFNGDQEYVELLINAGANVDVQKEVSVST